MYEEGKKRLDINWGSLIIKLLIVAIVIFVACFIFSKITSNKKNSNDKVVDNKKTSEVTKVEFDFDKSINSMKEVALEYFIKVKLPEKAGSSEKLTLGEMIDKKLITDFSDNGKICDKDNSYIEATRTMMDNYALKINLSCGKKEDYILSNIEKDKICVNNTCNNNNNSDNKEIASNEKNNSSSNGSSSSSSSNGSNKNNSTGSKKKSTTTTTTTTVTVKIKCINGCCGCCTSNCKKEDTAKKVRYYEYVKWSDWTEGYSYNSKAENKSEVIKTYNYCKSIKKEYYASAFKSDKNNINNFTYDFYLDLPNDVNSVSVVSSSYFDSSINDYQAFINNRSNYKMGSNIGSNVVNINNASLFRRSSLEKDNFTYSISKAKYDYAQRDWVVPITINYLNSNKVKAYYASNVDSNIYFAPVKFIVSYTKNGNCQRDLESNESKYKGYVKLEEKSITKRYHKIPEYTWSKENSLDGYTKTGNYEDRDV